MPYYLYYSTVDMCPNSLTIETSSSTVVIVVGVVSPPCVSLGNIGTSDTLVISYSYWGVLFLPCTILSYVFSVKVRVKLYVGFPKQAPFQVHYLTKAMSPNFNLIPYIFLTIWKPTSELCYGDMGILF